MTARKAPNPDGLNDHGNGKGLKKVTRPITKQRGGAAPRGAALQKTTSRSLTSIPVAELQTMELNQPLTDKAKAFVKFWAQGESIATASARAGYGDGASYCHRIKHLPEVRAMYAAEKALYEEASQMTRKRVMDGLLEGIDMAKLAGEPASVISGWREIGKMCGYYEPVVKRLEITHSGSVISDRMNRLSDAELLKLISETVHEEVVDDDNDETAPR